MPPSAPNNADKPDRSADAAGQLPDPPSGGKSVSPANAPQRRTAKPAATEAAAAPPLGERRPAWAEPFEADDARERGLGAAPAQATPEDSGCAPPEGRGATGYGGYATGEEVTPRPDNFQERAQEGPENDPT